MFAVNTRGPYVGMRAVLPSMLEHGRGAIINISSGNAQRPDPGSLPYAPSKAALEQLTRVVSAEFGPRGININALHPGGPAATSIFSANRPPSYPHLLRPPEIICPAAVWLGSDDCDVQGQVINCREWNRAHGLPDGAEAARQSVAAGKHCRGFFVTSHMALRPGCSYHGAGTQVLIAPRAEPLCI